MFGNGSAAASSRPTALREAGANGSGGSRPGQHIPDTNTPGCPYQKGQTHNGYLSDDGGRRWADLASLIETCKLNGVNPQVYFTDLLTRLVNGWPQSRIDELMPWHWAPAKNS
jgi:hypothetical protein